MVPAQAGAQPGCAVVALNQVYTGTTSHRCGAGYVEIAAPDGYGDRTDTNGYASSSQSAQAGLFTLRSEPQGLAPANIYPTSDPGCFINGSMTQGEKEVKVDAVRQVTIDIDGVAPGASATVVFGENCAGNWDNPFGMAGRYLTISYTADPAPTTAPPTTVAPTTAPTTSAPVTPPPPTSTTSDATPTTAPDPDDGREGLPDPKPDPGEGGGTLPIATTTTADANAATTSEQRAETTVGAASEDAQGPGGSGQVPSEPWYQRFKELLAAAIGAWGAIVAALIGAAVVFVMWWLGPRSKNGPSAQMP